MESPQGFLWSGISSGVKRSGRPDLGLAFSSFPATVAGVFTTNKLAAAPVLECQRRLEQGGKFRGLVVNSGVANAATGERGGELNRKMIASAANRFGLDESEVLSASTGVIGADLPLAEIEAAFPEALDCLEESPANFSKSILTTDTAPKVVSTYIDAIDARMVGIGKGAGMINPRMATMLTFIFLDHPVNSQWWQASLEKTCADSFNQISVDGDMSTNDTALAWAADLPDKERVNSEHPAAEQVQNGLEKICSQLAEMMVSDGEGATCLIEVKVTGAADERGARLVAEEIAGSTLVKTAFYGRDPNWGRIFSSVGASGADVKAEKLLLKLNGEVVFADNKPRVVSDSLKKSMRERDRHLIEVQLGLGTGSARRLTCDLSEEYVRINSDYHS